MPVEPEKIAYTAKPDNQAPQVEGLKASTRKARRLSGGECSSPEKAPDKMGSILSSVTKHITPKALAAHGSSEPDEIPSRPGSASSREHDAGPDASLQSSLLWPYVSSGTHDDDSESEHPLRSRRPALYEEYWADESD